MNSSNPAHSSQSIFSIAHLGNAAEFGDGTNSRSSLFSEQRFSNGRFRFLRHFPRARVPDLPSAGRLFRIGSALVLTVLFLLCVRIWHQNAELRQMLLRMERKLAESSGAPEPEKMAQKMEMPKSPVSSSDDEWSNYRLKLNKVFAASKKGYTFLEAHAECAKHGANLASVHSAKENAFIAALVKKTVEATKCVVGVDQYFWIGMRHNWNHSADHSEAEWTDGSPVDFGAIPRGYPWARNQLDNSGGAEDCTMLYGWANRDWGYALGEWNDIHCDWNTHWGGARAGVVCQRTAAVVVGR